MSDLNVEKAARVMANIDPAHAESFLLSASVLDTERHDLRGVLRVIGEFNFEISPATVKSLVSTYASRSMEYPNTISLGGSLALLGKFQDPDDKQLLERYINHEDEMVSAGAADGLISFHDLQGFEERIWTQEEVGGWKSLNREQQMFAAVYFLDGEVNNGGYAQYFFNSSGDNWRIALEGLKEMGFKQRVEIFEGVLSCFGDQMPSADRETRQDQLATVYAKHEGTFDRFDSAYYEADESVSVFSTRFVIQNADKFDQ